MIKNKKKGLIIIGGGKNQTPFIKYLANTEYFIIVIDRQQKTKFNVNMFIKHSIYNHDIKQITKKLKDINIKHIIYRSSGPSILLTKKLDEYFNINRISKDLASSIYSKKFFQNFLKKKKFNHIKSLKFSIYKNITFNIKKIVKPDVPVKGKNGLFVGNKFTKKQILKSKNNSHNKKIVISDFIIGRDINLFFVINNKKNIYKKLAIFEELNFVKSNEIKSHGIVYPVRNIKTKILKKIENKSIKLIKNFKNFRGIISLSARITPQGQFFFYEINIGLSGDGFADKIFPKIYKNKTLYEIELDALLKKKIKQYKFSKSACSTLNSTIFNQYKKNKLI